MGRGGTLAQIKGFDAFSKTMEDVRVRTKSGALITLISGFMITLLVLSEWRDYRSVEMKSELVVDKSRGEKMFINVNITFPRVPCYLLSVDVMDLSGEAQPDIAHDVHKTRLDENGVLIDLEKLKFGDESKKLSEAAEKLKDPDYCGSCFGGEAPDSGCCNTCDEVQESYARKGWGFNDPDSIEQCVREGWKEKIEKQSHEGCNVAGNVRVNKVMGNFHFAPGSTFSGSNIHIHDIIGFMNDPAKHDFSHTIHQFSFGPQPIPGSAGATKLFNPLDGTKKMVKDGNYMFQYFIKVVGTQFYYLDRPHFSTNQYSVTQHQRDVTGKNENTVAGSKMQASNQGGIPGVFFTYDISPMLVVHTEKRKTFGHFLTGVCAIVGGVLTLAGIVDGMVYNTQKTIKRKLTMSKHH